MTDSKADITLREITRETVRAITSLRVAPEQERFVAPTAVSIAEAHFSPELAWFRAIYLGETPVGFVMLDEQPAEAKYFLWRFMVDGRFQGRGVGRRALELVLERVKANPGAKMIETSVVPGPGSPGPFYERMGFVYTGAEEEGERVMRRDV